MYYYLVNFRPVLLGAPLKLGAPSARLVRLWVNPALLSALARWQFSFFTRFSWNIAPSSAARKLSWSSQGVKIVRYLPHFPCFSAWQHKLSALYAISNPPVCLSGCLSVTRVAQPRRLIHPCRSPYSSSFCGISFLQNFDGFFPSGDVKQEWGGENKVFFSFVRQHLKNGKRYDQNYYQ